MSVIFFIGVLIAAFLSFKFYLLTKSGAIASIFVGGGILLGTGIRGLFLLAVFFLTSSLLSKWKKKRKKQAENIVEKGSTRDASQVLANGLAATIFSVLYYFFDSEFLLYGFILSLAIATSDTWASELGVLSKDRPIHIRTLKRVDRGMSGAISVFGTFMSLLGSFLISFLGYVLFSISITTFIIITVLGFLGCMVDTVLGAYAQVSYRCQVCGKRVEMNKHCNKPTIDTKGISWMNNDLVNFLATFGWSVVVIVLWYIILS